MASIGLKINDSSGSGISSGVADVFAKALFGDPEAAAKVALAHAQIANYGASTSKTLSDIDVNKAQISNFAENQRKLQAEEGNLNATATKTGVETQRQVAAQNARNDWVTPLGDELANAVNKPTPVEKDRPLPDFQGPMPMVVKPEDAANYATAVAAARARAKAIALGTTGDNPVQLTEAERMGLGISRYANPDPSTIRTDYTLLTGKEPTTAPLMKGDDAGTKQLIDVEQSKPQSAQTVTDKAGNVYQLIKGADGQVTGVRVPGIATATPDPTTDAEVQKRIDNINSILRNNPNPDITPDQAAQYATDINRRMGTETITEVDKNTGEEKSRETYKALPQGTARPEDVWNLAGKHGQQTQAQPTAQPTAQTVGGQTLGAPVPITRSSAPLPDVPTAPVRQTSMPVPVQMFDPATAGAPTPGAARAPPTNPWPLVPSIPGVVPPSGSLLPVAPTALTPPTPAAPAATAPVVPSVQTNERVTKAAPANPALSGEFPAKSRGFAERMADGVTYFQGIKPENIPDVWSVIRNIPGDNIPIDLLVKQQTSPAAKSYVVKALEAAFPGLRFDSGAAISREEISSALATEIPMPGDDQRTIDVKQSAMAAHLRSILSAGYGLNSDAYNQYKQKLLAQGYDMDRHDNLRATDIVFDQNTGAIKSGPGAPAAAPATAPAAPIATPAATPTAPASPTAPAAPATPVTSSAAPPVAPAAPAAPAAPPTVSVNPKTGNKISAKHKALFDELGIEAP